jgi:hypothetical protein
MRLLMLLPLSFGPGQAYRLRFSADRSAFPPARLEV